MKQPGALKPWLGNPDKAGSDNEHFKHPLGVACDKDGNVYVADSGNHRIQVFKPDGTYHKSLPVGEINKKPKGWGQWSPRAHQCHITADPFREELYIRENDMSYPSAMLRVDGRTGKVIDRFGSKRSRSGFGVEQAKTGPDGRLYIRSQSAGTRLVCYDPDTKMLVPLPEANKKVTVKFKGKNIPAVPIGASRGARTFQDMMGIAPNGDLYIPCGIRKKDKDLLKKKNLKAPTKKDMYNNPFAASLLKVYSAVGKLKCLSTLPGLGPSQGVEIGRSGAVYMALECHPVDIKTPEGLAPGAKSYPHYWGTVVKFNAQMNNYPVGSIEGRWSGKLKGKATHTLGMSYWGNNGPVRIENMLWDYPGMSTFRQRNCMCPKSNITLDGFERLFVPALHSCSVNVLDANGNIVTRIGAYGNADSRGKDSPVPDPETGELRPRREGDPEDLKSPLTEPEIDLCHPNFTAVTDEALYINDRGNERIVRAVLEYKTVKEIAVE